MKHALPSLSLKAPLFYNWPIGLRFDLQTYTAGEVYFSEVVRRSTALFEEVFEPNEEIVLICQIGRLKCDKIKFSNYCFRQISSLQRKEVFYKKLLHLYESKIYCKYYNRAVIKIKINRIDYKNIFIGIANRDFWPRKPRLDMEVYFVSLKREIIFNMYDDRGLDIIASNKQAIASLYHKYNSWLLDYDREAIDSVFKETNTKT